MEQICTSIYLNYSTIVFYNQLLNTKHSVHIILQGIKTFSNPILTSMYKDKQWWPIIGMKKRN